MVAAWHIFFVAIAYNKGVILCKQYHGIEFVWCYFPWTFERNKNPHGKLFLPDGDPRQVARWAENAMDDVGCRMLAILPRSPYLNLIENMLHLVRANLQKDAKKDTFFLIFTSRMKDYQKLTSWNLG